MPAPDNSQPPESITLDKFDGLKNTLSKERMGPADLVTAVNVDIDDASQISRRRGRTQVATGNFHSPFTTNFGKVLIVKDGMLSLLYPDYTAQSIVPIIGSDPSEGERPLAYVQIGGTVYYSGASDSGKVDLASFTASPWGDDPDLWLSPVVDPTATLAPVAGKLLGKPPNATAMDYFSGRIYLANDKTLWVTELYAYDFVDKNAGYKYFEAPITMVAAVSDGVFVGTEEGLWFLSGPSFAQMKRRRVMDSPVIPGSVVSVPGELGNPPQVGLQADTPVQVSVMFMTATGICVGGDGGQTTNLTESKFFFPAAVSAAALYRRQDGANAYVAVTQNGGTPSNTAAIGDYVDAVLIRRDTWREACDRVFVTDRFTTVWS